MRVGDCYHNIQVLDTKKGSLIIKRRPTQEEFVSQLGAPEDHTPYPGCLGFVLKRDLWRHAKN